MMHKFKVLMEPLYVISKTYHPMKPFITGLLSPIFLFGIFGLGDKNNTDFLKKVIKPRVKI